MPDQVIVNAQPHCEIRDITPERLTKSWRPETRAALAAYQADHDLTVTSGIDSPTLANLGGNMIQISVPQEPHSNIDVRFPIGRRDVGSNGRSTSLGAGMHPRNDSATLNKCKVRKV